jgi:hypothetical protein
MKITTPTQQKENSVPTAIMMVNRLDIPNASKAMKVMTTNAGVQSRNVTVQ